MAQKTEFYATLPGELKLAFLSMEGNEEVSGLFEFEVKLVGVEKTVAKADLLGKQMTVHVPGPDDTEVHFNGYVRRFVRHGRGGDKTYLYTATLCPWLWFLTRTRRSRIFQNKSVQDVLKDVFGDYGSIQAMRDDLSGSYPAMDYCVQYRESDFDFVSRLMQQAGIAYYFEHAKAKHTMVLVDDNTKFERGPAPDEIPFLPGGHEQDDGRGHVDELGCASAVQSGKIALRDFDFEKPSTLLEALKGTVAAGHDESEREVYDYPGSFLTNDRGTAIAKVQAEELESQREWIRGHGAMRNVRAGYRIKIKEPPDFIPTTELLVLSANHRITRGTEELSDSDEAHYDCDFLALDAKTPFRPARETPRPVVEGPQTAIVTGPSGEEIHTDKYGRIKIQFHWDRDGKSDENSSCWVRVAQPWAGKNWGFLTLPRIGQEVVVSFLEGDPDRPLVTGSVYNAEQMPPWTLPSKKVFSGIRTHTVQGGTTDFNEFRFSDQQGEELVYMHAQKDYEARIKNDRKEYVGNDSHLKVVAKRTEHVTGDFELKADANRKVKVGASDGLDVAQDMSVKAGSTISLKAGQNWQVQAGANAALDAAAEVHIKSAMIVVEASGMLTLKVGGSSVTVGPAGVTIDGPLVKINCGGSGGSGSGSHPQAPEAPADAAEAREPES